MLTNNFLTPEKLKTFKGLENLSDDCAKRLTEQINFLARLLIKIKPIQKFSANETDQSGGE
jgi:hypothetical protein